MRRGDLHSYVRPSTPTQQRTVVVLSNDGLNATGRPWLLGIELRADDPGDLLAIPVGDGRYAHIRDLSGLYRARVGRRVGRLDTATLGRVENALRAALDL